MATHPGDPSKPRELDAFDFQLTDLSEARSALDELPDGVREVQNLVAGGWEARRRKPVATDRALTGTALDWLMALPHDVRPRRMCESYPRVINLLAQNWADPSRRRATLHAMLNDTRGNRRGFPPDELRELQLLRHHAGV